MDEADNKLKTLREFGMLYMKLSLSVLGTELLNPKEKNNLKKYISRLCGQSECLRDLVKKLVKKFVEATGAGFGCILQFKSGNLINVLTEPEIKKYNDWCKDGIKKGYDRKKDMTEFIKIFLDDQFRESYYEPGKRSLDQIHIFKMHPFTEDAQQIYHGVLMIYDAEVFKATLEDHPIIEEKNEFGDITEIYPATLLARLISSWNAEVIKYRKDLFLHAKSILNRQSRDPRQQTYDQMDEDDALQQCAEPFQRMLTREETLLWARASIDWTKAGDLGTSTGEKVEFPDILKDFIANGYAECKQCPSPRWDGCGKIGRDIFARLLVDWCWWVNIKPSIITNIRNKGYIDIRNQGNERYAIERFKNWKYQVNQVRREANKSIAQNLVGGNLLPKGLLNFFFRHGLSPIDSAAYDPVAYWTSRAPSDAEVAQAYSSIAQIAHYLFTNLPSDKDTIMSLMWLVSEYCHKTLEIPERIDLRLHLLQAARGEPALHALKNYYRDHFFHALEVCFLGHFLLDLEIGGQPLWKLAAHEIGHPNQKKSILRLWYLTALLHDIGYGIDVLKAVADLLKFFQNDEHLKDLCANIEGAIGNLSARLDLFQGYRADDKPGEDHGVVGARHLQEMLKKIAKDDPEIKVAEYEPAIRAIARHGSRKHTVSFAADPLGFLLILCDTIQEWNRPHLDFASAPTRILSRLISHGITEEDFTGPLDKVAINAEAIPGGDGFRLKDGKLLFRLNYAPEIQVNAGVFNLWLDASCNFQRLDLAGLPADFDIEIEYITPPFQHSPGEGPAQQFQRLRDAARDTHMGFLEKWFPNRPLEPPGRIAEEITNGAVSYYPVYKNGKLEDEHLTLHLRELTSHKRITKDIAEFRKLLKNWKDYNIDREFSGDYGNPDFPS